MIYFFTGMPLSGKSTIARRLAAEEDLRYLSTGEYARSLGMGMEDSIRTRDLSDRFDGQIIERVIKECSSGNVVIDGFPRYIEQVNVIMENISLDYNIYFVTANPLVIFDRIESRSVVEGRPEDNYDVVASRIDRSNEWRRELMATCHGVKLVRADEFSIDTRKVVDILGVQK